MSTKKDTAEKLGAGMLAGFELGYDAACKMLEAMEEGDDMPGWAPRLKGMKQKQLDNARKTINGMIEAAR